MFNVCTMVYVKDVVAMTDFFLNIGFVEVKRLELGETHSVILAPHLKSDANIQLFNIEFIKKMSPEVAGNVPSLLFVVDDIKRYHERVSKVADKTSEIVQMGDKYSFNFFDPEGRAYAFMEG